VPGYGPSFCLLPKAPFAPRIINVQPLHAVATTAINKPSTIRFTMLFPQLFCFGPLANRPQQHCHAGEREGHQEGGGVE
jgi:hypothetical protein